MIHLTLCKTIQANKILCRWQTAPGDALLQRIAASTEGFAGADLQALCTAAVMAAVTRSCPNLVDQLCHTAPAGLCPHPASRSGREPNQHHKQQQQQQPQQQQPVEQQQQQLGEVQQQQQTDKQQQPGKQQQQQMHVARCSPDNGNPTAPGGMCSHSAAQLAQEQQQPNRQQQPNQEQEQMQAKQQPKQQRALQQQQQQQGTGDQITQATKQNQAHIADEPSEKVQKKVLTKLRVKAVDWRTALAAAPLPCSARQSLSALSSGHARALPHHLVPLLSPCITRALQCVAAAQLPWQGATATALDACAAAARSTAAAAAGEAERDAAARRTLEGLLAEHGAVEGPGSAEASESRHIVTATADGLLANNTTRVAGSRLSCDHAVEQHG